jgi:hypothetical protein
VSSPNLSNASLLGAKRVKLDRVISGMLRSNSPINIKMVQRVEKPSRPHTTSTKDVEHVGTSLGASEGTSLGSSEMELFVGALLGTSLGSNDVVVSSADGTSEGTSDTSPDGMTDADISVSAKVVFGTGKPNCSGSSYNMTSLTT